MENINPLITEKGVYCEINKQYYSTLRGMLNYLRKVNITSQEYYLTYIGDIGKCLYCNNSTKFHQIDKGYRIYCSVGCKNKSKEHKECVKNRFVNNPEKKKSFIEKSKQTKSNWSDEYKDMISQKRILSYHSKYGKNYFSEKAKRQWERRTSQDIENIVEKSKQTKIKNNYQPTPYKNSNKVFECGGITFRVQGYEDIAIRLLSKLIEITEIKTGDQVPRINLPEDKKYYPDLYYKNLLIEVKSEYTFNINLEENIIKHKSSINQGYNHIFLVIHSKDVTKDRTLKNEDKYLSILHKAISSQASNILEEGSTTIP
jgi:hypothetical protein